MEIPTGFGVLELSELDQRIRSKLNDTTAELVQQYQNIMNYLIVIFEGFESQLQYVRNLFAEQIFYESETFRTPH